MKTFKLFFVLAVIGVSAVGESPLRVVDTLADLDQLYPNVEQPTAIVRGRLVRDDYSPPRIYFWNPDSSATTNDSIRPVRFGLGRWIYTTNVVFEGRMTVGHTNQFGATATFKGFLFGTSGLIMERFGVGTNGISIAGDQVSFRREDPGVSRFITTFANTDTTASMYLGGNSYPGFTSGRSSAIFAAGVDLTTTNENKVGANLDLYAGSGSGIGAPPRIGFRVPTPNTNSPTAGQTNILTVGEFRFPAFPSLTNNTSFRISFLDGSGTTNFVYTNRFIRMVLTNESGIWRNYWEVEP